MVPVTLPYEMTFLICWRSQSGLLINLPMIWQLSFILFIQIMHKITSVWDDNKDLKRKESLSPTIFHMGELDMLSFRREQFCRHFRTNKLKQIENILSWVETSKLKQNIILSSLCCVAILVTLNTETKHKLMDDGHSFCLGIAPAEEQ